MLAPITNLGDGATKSTRWDLKPNKAVVLCVPTTGASSIRTRSFPSGLSSLKSSNNSSRSSSTGSSSNSSHQPSNLPLEKGRCNRCGIKTHTVSVFSRPLTTSDVYKGRCIRCNPMLVPCSVRNQWEIQNAALLVQEEVGTTSRSSPEVRGFSGKDNPGRQSNLGACLDDMEEEVVNPHNSKNHAKRHCNRCSGCGVRTHKSILGKRFPVTTATVFDGHCIKCAPLDVPLGVLQKWQNKHKRRIQSNIPDTLDVVLDIENPSIAGQCSLTKSIPSTFQYSELITRVPRAEDHTDYTDEDVTSSSSESMNDEINGDVLADASRSESFARRRGFHPKTIHNGECRCQRERANPRKSLRSSLSRIFRHQHKPILDNESISSPMNDESEIV